MKKARLARAFLWCSIGLIYLVLARLAIFSIPCPFRYVTGLLCPGCGITTMLIALSRGDIATAYAANPVLFTLSPLILWLAITDSRSHSSKAHHLATIIIIAALLAWGIWRNIFPA